MKNKTYIILHAVSLILTVVVNYLSNTGIFNGNTMKTVSDEYFTLFTPAGYAFSIWGIIYLGLASFIIYTGTHVFKGIDPMHAVKKIGWWFLVSCLANMLWVVAWLNHYTLLSVMLMVILLLSLLIIVSKLELSLHKVNTKNYMFIALPFSLYAGWISLAIIANIAALLVKIQWDGFGLHAEIWALVMIAIAGIINMLMVLMRNMKAYGIVGIWGVLAVAANQSSAGSNITYACYVVSALILLAILFNLFRPTKFRRDLALS
ncbi:hypothetical protein [Sphingobacterium deserti]|uniref:Tryptophan-rich sensory protein n=1 Tax=Sphingobacterium deserti TaxID=1229276 RepID=A0A0B8SYT2_9SPHI|nr:hypothetical protein [Sphingobacterium deserti]KGE12587.1 hypothetical protein DI53_3627 [Sphingobacterium deserti]